MLTRRRSIVTTEHPPGLEELAAAYHEELELEFRRDPAVPDLADVFARARVLDEAKIPAGLHGKVGPNVPDHIELPDDGQDAPAPDLAMFAAALREDVEADADKRKGRPIDLQRPRPSRRGRAAIATIAALAAVLIAVVSVSLSNAVLATPYQQVVETASAQAHLSIASDKALESVLVREAATTRLSDQRRRQAAPPPLEPVAPTEETELLEQPTATPTPTPRRASLAELEAEAKDAWAEGDLALAERRLRQVVARAGRSSRAELAYGDLFAVARQRGGIAAQTKVWKEYARRFPGGRYSDDTRAGLCIRSTPSERSGCWEEYLEAFPRGAHAELAKRNLRGSSPR